MKPRPSLLNWLLIAVALSPLVFLAIIWKGLPEIVPVHYDIHLSPDRMDKKNALWLANGALSLVSILIYLLLINLHRIDPRRRKQAPSLSFKRIGIVAVVFITVLNFLILLSINNNIILSSKWLFILMGLLITFLGNYMNNLKPNYFAGIRLPWTLSSDYNWKKTHQLAGKLWFWGGLLSVITTLLIPSGYAAQTFFGLLGVIVIFPVIYSYRLFKQEKINQY